MKGALFRRLMELDRFRRFIVNNLTEAEGDMVDWDEAEKLWSHRYPQIQWELCLAPECERLVPVEDRFCPQHGAFPRWALSDTVLFKRLKLNRGSETSPDYKPYFLHLAESIIGGTVPKNYHVICRDGNPFNLRKENLMIVAEMAVALAKKGLITLAECEEVSELLGGFIEERRSDGRPVFSVRFNYSDIARAAGISVGSVRVAASRKKLDPCSLSDIVRFCISHKSRRNGLGKSGHSL